MPHIGIDLGTTNSLVAVFKDGKPQLIPNAAGEVLTPSVVGERPDGMVDTGQIARERLFTHPQNTVASFKRFMGTTRETRLGKLKFRPEELSSLILRSLKADAENHLQEPVDSAVISVPAYFNDIQRKATIDAGKLAGLRVDRLINEPTAAALAYGVELNKEGKYLVFDLGGGTFDVSILDVYDGVFEVRATAGDNRLGGDDFTHVLAATIAGNHKINLSELQADELGRILFAGERIKKALTSKTEIEYGFDAAGKRIEGTVTRAAFETAASSLLQKLRQPVERAISDAVLRPSDLTSVIMVGGATRMPSVRSLVARLFGRLPLVHVDPDTVVALGAAVQAALVGRDSALEDRVMTDVCPFTLGTSVAKSREDISSSIYLPIIERNAIVPISRTTTVSTISDYQTMVRCDVYQGEHMRPENNVQLGSLDIDVPRNKAGMESIDIRFTYDVSGVLEVEVTVNSTMRSKREIFRNSSGLTEAELKSRFGALQAIKLRPREQTPNAVLMARAERLYAENIGEAREALRQMTGEFETAITNQQLRNLDKLRQQFSAELDSFERSRFRFDDQPDE